MQTHPTLLVYHVFLFNDSSTTKIYTLSLHDALPISVFNINASSNGSVVIHVEGFNIDGGFFEDDFTVDANGQNLDRKSTRLNSSHGYISYAVFCLKKKIKKHNTTQSAINKNT